MKVNCRLPKALKAWCEKNADKIVEIDYGDGYNTESGMAYDILLASGWHAYGDAVHTIIEQTATETLKQLRSIEYDPEAYCCHKDSE